MKAHQIFDLALALSGPVLLLALTISFIKRKLYKRFPYFFVYVLYSTIAGVLREIPNNQPMMYFVLYWSTEAIYSLLALAAINEAFKRVFFSFYLIYSWFRFVLPGIIVFVLLLATWEKIRFPPPHVPRFVAAIYSADLGIHWIELGILLFFILLVKFYGLGVEPREFGIILGFGTSAIVTMLADLLRSEFGTKFELCYRYAPPLGYLLAVAMWLYVFLRPEPPKKKTEVDPKQLLELLQWQMEMARKMFKWRRKDDR